MLWEKCLENEKEDKFYSVLFADNSAYLGY